LEQYYRKKSLEALAWSLSVSLRARPWRHLPLERDLEGPELSVDVDLDLSFDGGYIGIAAASVAVASGIAGWRISRRGALPPIGFVLGLERTIVVTFLMGIAVVDGDQLSGCADGDFPESCLSKRCPVVDLRSGCSSNDLHRCWRPYVRPESMAHNVA